MSCIRQFGPLRHNRQRGYILLTLMLFFAILAITAVAIAPSITFQIQRDREEELIHRGVQYSRATRRYFKKFGRYPTRIEDLENTNNIRFLRKRYKDPVTGKDFKLLHVGEVKLMMGGGVAGASSIGQPIGAGPAGTNLASPGPGGRADSGMPGSAQRISQKQNAAAPDQTDADASATPTTNSDTNSGSNSSTNSGSNPNSPGGGNNLSAQVFGGGPIVGVASTSKDQTIREFNKKNHYEDWQFIYDPGTDRGGLINTPAQPALQGSIAIPQPIAPAVTGGFGGMSGGMNGGMSGQPGQQPTSAQPPQSGMPQPQR
jgi:type II secretory pathway pseudopilin PulG